MVMRMIADSTGATDQALAYVAPELRTSWRAARALANASTDNDWSAIYRADQARVRTMQDAGVLLLAGTDVAVPTLIPGHSLHDELELLATSGGLTPAEALAAATINPARVLGLEASLGTVAPGKTADLVLLDADPLVDIRATRRIHAVIAAGRLYDRAGIDRLLAGARAPNGGPARRGPAR
jgi:imidazolonepropionase-like amidohydrolase